MNTPIHYIDKNNILILICILIIIFIYLIYTLNNNQNNETFNSDNSETLNNINNEVNYYPKWKRPECGYVLEGIMERAFNKNMFKEVDTFDADLIIPCSYNSIESEILSMPINYFSKPRKIFIIDGADEIAAKDYLWNNIVSHYGLEHSKLLCPNTYILSGKQKDIDMKRLENESNKDKIYIMKKNIQRQEGLNITKNIQEITENKDDYVLVQEMLMDSYLVNKRKINLRVYVLVKCYKDTTNVFIFNEGFMYYAKKHFDNNDISEDNNITTGYVDRDVYKKNPLTHTDFKRYLDLDEGKKYYYESEPRELTVIEKRIRNQGLKLSDVIFNRIEKLLSDIFISFKGKICKDKCLNNFNPIYNDESYQLFGADVAVNNNLQAQIIELNKGPDLSSKDKKDGEIKEKLMDDVLEIMGLRRKSNTNGFKKILDM
jgi:hypothetical protein